MRMFKSFKLGVVGAGFVGTALIEGMKHAFEDSQILVFDKFLAEKSNVSSIEEMTDKADVIFVCVPTPMRAVDGKCDTSIVEGVLAEINATAKAKKTVVIKSTVKPGTTEKLSKDYNRINLLFNPEFLTEANAINDFKNQDRIVIGYASNAEACAIEDVIELYKHSYPGVIQAVMASTAAEMIKYTTNCFLATKVSFANEIYQICEKLGVNYSEMIEAAQLDKRLGFSHWRVPGPDGAFGFGLSCFPKDINGLTTTARELGIDPKVMAAVWEKNLEVREPAARDWEKMKRAFVTNE